MEHLLVFADLHAHNFKEFDEKTSSKDSSRLSHITETLYAIGDYALQNGIKTILFAGDLFHVRGKINTLVFNAIFNAIQDITIDTGISIIMIPGNHDQVDNSDYPKHSLSSFSSIKGVTVLDKIEFYELEDLSILSVPYSKNAVMVRESIKKACEDRKSDKPAILLGHLGISGGLVGKGNYAMADSFTVEDLMPDYFKAIYLGHFHKYQLLGGYDHVMYTGAPIQHSFSDEGEPKGFVEARLIGDRVVSQFVPLQFFYQSGQVIPTFHTIRYPEDKDSISAYSEMDGEVYFRFLVEESQVESLKANIPDGCKYKLEITRKYEEQERTEVKVGMTFEEIVKTYAEEHNPEATELGLDILREAGENRV